MFSPNNKLPKILMLGWEFPPIINGGLGVACHDLAMAMSNMAEITMIIPQATEKNDFGKLNLIGVNNAKSSLIKKTSKENLKFEKINLPENLNPYYFEETNRFLHEEKDWIKKSKSFTINSLYGPDILEKVKQFAEQATEIALKKDFDIIHCHDWMTMLAGMAIKEKTKKPLVAHIHSLELDRGGEYSKGWVYQTEKAGMENADMLLAVSQFTANNIHRHYGIEKQKIATVHNGIRKVKTYRGKKNYREKTVLFVGRLTRQKGPEYFLEIASLVIQANPDVRFVVAGSGDSYQKMIQYSAGHHLGNKIHFTGFLNTRKLDYLMSIADVYVMPSVSEPFGLSAVEAAQFGIPCVISKQSGVSEVLPASLTFNFWDTKKAASYILNLLEDQVLCEKIKTDAFNNLNCVSWEIAAKKVMNQYQKL